MREQHTLQPVDRSWVDAAPFRAHVRHAIAVAGVPWPAFAVESGVPIPAVRTLLFGRGNGRPLTRIEPRIAAMVLRTGAPELAGLRHTWVSADATSQRLRGLLGAGVDPVGLAQWCGLSAHDMARLVEGDAPSCARLTECLSVAAERLAAAPVLHQRAA